MLLASITTAIADVENFNMLNPSRGPKLDNVALTRLHQGSRDRRYPTHLLPIEIGLVDAKVTVDRSNDEQHAIVKAAIAQGVMRLTRLTRQITTYRVKTADPGEHHLLIEHPRLVGWSLTAPDPTHVELSANAYRIPVTLPGDTQGTLAVTMEHPLEETIRLLDLTDDRLGVLVASNEIEPSVKNALGEPSEPRSMQATRRSSSIRMRR